MKSLAHWPALVLTAGLATRLQPLSTIRAKAALPVAGETLVLRILRWLHGAGVRRVVLNLHHRADSITRIVGDGSRAGFHPTAQSPRGGDPGFHPTAQSPRGGDPGLSVRYSWETEVLGSAGGPARAIPLLESDRFLIVNGDTLTDVDLSALAAQHVDTNAMVTMAVVDADPRYNAIVANDAGIVTGFSKREPGTLSNPALGTIGTIGTPGTGRFHFIGVQAVNASVFAGVSPEVKSETVHGIYPGLIAGRNGSLRVFHTTKEFFDIGSPRDYLQTALTLARRESRSVDRGRDCVVAADAIVRNTVLWDRVTVGAGAHLNHCVVADDVTVPAGARHADCSLVMRGREMIVAPF
jgi:mannose-1-phosphate guanylyltransferase